jgi:hypothetical protein
MGSRSLRAGCSQYPSPASECELRGGQSSAAGDAVYDENDVGDLVSHGPSRDAGADRVYHSCRIHARDMRQRPSGKVADPLRILKSTGFTDAQLTQMHGREVRVEFDSCIYTIIYLN